MTVWTDTHLHVCDSQYDSDRAVVLERALGAGVTTFIEIAESPNRWDAAVRLAEAHPFVYASLGIHPHHAEEVSSASLPEKDPIQELASLATHPKVVAIGEIGLDYYRSLSPRPIQQELLRKQLRLAHEMSKPVILHCRDQDNGKEAYHDLFAILQECLKAPLRGLLHCFTGDLNTAQQAIDLGLHISFAANLTFTNADRLREVAFHLPFDRILLETDAPFLAPQAYRGKRNEPAYLPELARTWSKIRDLTEEDVARVTTVNAYELFGIGEAPPPGQIAYPIRRSLYVNLTNACTDRCVFCALSTEDFWAGKGAAPIVKGHHLRMQRDPTAEEVLKAAGDPGRYEEIVFGGYGEPILRLKILLEVARALKGKGARWIRLNTNGHGNLIHRHPIAVELKGLVDEVSVSLNTATAEEYMTVCRPVFGLPTYESIKAFIRECRDAGLKVVATAVAMPGVDVEACRRVAEEELKVPYRVRTYNDLG